MSVVDPDGKQLNLPRRRACPRPDVRDVRALVAAFLYDQQVPVETAAAALGINKRAYWDRLNRAARLRARARVKAAREEGEDLA